MELINKEESEAYEYAAEVLWMLLIPFVMIFPINLLMGLSYEGYLLLIPFTVLRRVCGGFHFKDERVCYVVSILFLLCIVAVSELINSDIEIICTAILGALSLISGSTILRGGCEHWQNRKEVFFTNFFWIIIVFAFMICGQHILAKWISMGIAMTAILQYPLIIQNILSKK